MLAYRYGIRVLVNSTWAVCRKGEGSSASILLERKQQRCVLNSSRVSDEMSSKSWPLVGMQWEFQKRDRKSVQEAHANKIPGRTTSHSRSLPAGALSMPRSNVSGRRRHRSAPLTETRYQASQCRTGTPSLHVCEIRSDCRDRINIAWTFCGVFGWFCLFAPSRREPPIPVPPAGFC